MRDLLTLPPLVRRRSLDINLVPLSDLYNTLFLPIGKVLGSMNQSETPRPGLVLRQ